MKLTTFIDTIHNQSTLSPVHCFVGQSVPILLIAKLQEFIRKKSNAQFSFLQGDTGNVSQTQGQLQSSFLGQASCYWLSLETMTSEWNSFLKGYKGPNTIFYVSTRKPDSDAVNVIELPDSVDKDLFDALGALVEHANSDFSRSLFKHVDKISLDQAVLLMQYGLVVGRNSELFFEQWFNDIVVPDTSLFELSQHFFAKKPRLFFTLWNSVYAHYAPQFWITFFSEQLWRAAWYVHYQQLKQITEAKKIGFRLPFSYLNRDFRNYSFNELIRALQELYCVDYELKNGGNDFQLELFLSKFMGTEYRK